MKRMLFTIPDNIANTMRQFIPAGERSEFVVRYIEIPLQELQKKKKRTKKTATPKYKASFIRDLKKAEAQVKRGEVYSHEEIMKEFGLL